MPVLKYFTGTLRDGKPAEEELSGVRALSLFAEGGQFVFGNADECIKAWMMVHEAQHAYTDLFNEVKKRAEVACGGKVRFVLIR